MRLKNTSMKVLAINCGSSTLKFELLQLGREDKDQGQEKRLARGLVEEIGAYLAALGGADALVFGGGIGENAPIVRARICAGMEWCGVQLDADRNNKAMGSEALISADDATVHAYVTRLMKRP